MTTAPALQVPQGRQTITVIARSSQGISELIFLGVTVGFHHIRVHAPGATEAATVGHSFICKKCYSPLKEDVKFRVLGGQDEACE